MMDRSFFNILLMSTCFLLVYAALGTANYIQVNESFVLIWKEHLILTFRFRLQKVMVDSVNNQYPAVEWSGFYSLFLMYSFFTFSNFLVPSVLTVISTKMCLFLASLLHLISYLVFFYPVKFGLNIASCSMGFAAACLWSTQGKCLIENSDPNNIDRNVSIFWAIFEFGLVLGSLYFFVQFEGIEAITERDRFLIYTVLLTIGLVGSVSFLILKTNTKDEIIDISIRNASPISALKRCFAMFKTKKMILLTIACFYTGEVLLIH